MEYRDDIEKCLVALQSGGVILFPTDTIWGLGCDATNESAVEKILQIKQRGAAQGLIVLLADEHSIVHYASPVDTTAEPVIRLQQKPTTIIYEGGKNVASNILPGDHTLAIRVVKEAFCQELIRRFGKPIVSTSANIHGHPSPQNFSEIAEAVSAGADYVVQYRQPDTSLYQPSAILKIRPDGVEVIRP